jgi:hypothetical protein
MPGAGLTASVLWLVLLVGCVRPSSCWGGAAERQQHEQPEAFIGWGGETYRPQQPDTPEVRRRAGPWREGPNCLGHTEPADLPCASLGVPPPCRPQQQHQSHRKW